MKDKNLRRALGIHGTEENLCGCSMGSDVGWHGEIPMLWKKIEEFECKIKDIEVKKTRKKKSNKANKPDR